MTKRSFLKTFLFFLLWIAVSRDRMGERGDSRHLDSR